MQIELSDVLTVSGWLVLTLVGVSGWLGRFAISAQNKNQQLEVSLAIQHTSENLARISETQRMLAESMKEVFGRLKELEISHAAIQAQHDMNH
ncbi:MAG: hypothetical protein WCH05_05565 [Chlorobiaceae bacterium]